MLFVLRRSAFLGSDEISPQLIAIIFVLLLFFQQISHSPILRIIITYVYGVKRNFYKSKENKVKRLKGLLEKV